MRLVFDHRAEDKGGSGGDLSDVDHVHRHAADQPLP